MHRPISNRRAAFHILGVVLLIAVSLAVLSKIGMRTGVLGRSTELTVRFGRVDGLRAGDQVRLQGLRIGSVSRIDPPAKAGEDLVVRLKVDPSIARLLRSDCSASIAFQGMIGQPVVELAAGSADAGELDPARPLNGRTSDGIAQLTQRASESLARANSGRTPATGASMSMRSSAASCSSIAAVYTFVVEPICISVLVRMG